MTTEEKLEMLLIAAKAVLQTGAEHIAEWYKNRLYADLEDAIKEVES